MVEIEIHKSRDEIEEELREMGYELTYEWEDDQIWTNKEQDELLWISWINASLWEFHRTRKHSLL